MLANKKKKHDISTCVILEIDCRTLFHSNSKMQKHCLETRLATICHLISDINAVMRTNFRIKPVCRLYMPTFPSCNIDLTNLAKDISVPVVSRSFFKFLSSVCNYTYIKLIFSAPQDVSIWSQLSIRNTSLISDRAVNPLDIIRYWNIPVLLPYSDEYRNKTITTKEFLLSRWLYARYSNKIGFHGTLKEFSDEQISAGLQPRGALPLYITAPHCISYGKPFIEKSDAIAQKIRLLSLDHISKDILSSYNSSFTIGHHLLANSPVRRCLRIVPLSIQPDAIPSKTVKTCLFNEHTSLGEFPLKEIREFRALFSDIFNSEISFPDLCMTQE